MYVCMPIRAYNAGEVVQVKGANDMVDHPVSGAYNPNPMLPIIQCHKCRVPASTRATVPGGSAGGGGGGEGDAYRVVYQPVRLLLPKAEAEEMGISDPREGSNKTAWVRVFMCMAWRAV